MAKSALKIRSMWECQTPEHKRPKGGGAAQLLYPSTCTEKGLQVDE